MMKPNRRTHRGLGALVCVSSAIALAGNSDALADAIVVSRAMTASTIAEVFIEEDSIRVELEISVQDLEAFRNLLPDKLCERLGYEAEPWEQRIVRFFAEDWVIRADEGDPLVGRVESMEPGRRLRRDKITGEPLPVQPEDAEVVVRVTLTYTLATRPATLSLSPPVKAGTSIVTANIGFVVYHRGLAVNDFRYLAATEPLKLDWDDPWYSRFTNRNLRRQFDAPLSVFLYVEHFEVRKEIIIRPKDAQQWLDLGLEGKQVIPVAEQEALKQRIADFLIERGDVLIDGRRIGPVLDRVHFVRRTLRRTGVIDPPEDLDVASATLGVIFVYPIEGLPEEATLEWDLFGPRIRQVAAAATDEAGGLPAVLTPEDPTLRWQNFLTNPKVPAMVAVTPPPAPPRITLPLVSVVCGLAALSLAVGIVRIVKAEQVWSRGLVAGCVGTLACGALALPYARVSVTIPVYGSRSINAEEARAVLGDLLHNIYRAFDWRDESVIYDRLALSIAGDLLSDVYLQTRRGMELEGQGGARVKVDAVDILDGDPEDVTESGGFVYRCRWNASGSVGHWGHIHRRTNQYEAVFTVEPIEGRWRIAAIDLREERRIDVGAAPPASGG